MDIAGLFELNTMLNVILIILQDPRAVTNIKHIIIFIILSLVIFSILLHLPLSVAMCVYYVCATNKVLES